MTKRLPVKARQPKVGELQNLIPEPMLFLDEAPDTYWDLRDALVADLAPATTYERALALNLVTLDWEMIRHRRLRDTVVKAKARDLAIGVYATGRIREVSDYTNEHRDLAIALVNGDTERTVEAISELVKRKVTATEILAKAYHSVAHQVERHEKELASLETRRRRLREDYERLKAARPKPVEEAEIVE